jgi:hypothetical protein
MHLTFERKRKSVVCVGYVIEIEKKKVSKG